MAHFQSTTERPVIGSTIAGIAAANTALILGLLAKLSWQECLMLIVAVAALGGGIVFTILEMQSLGKEGK